jgi:hypothetical protein
MIVAVSNLFGTLRVIVGQSPLVIHRPIGDRAGNLNRVLLLRQLCSDFSRL